jgi:hypothetical protein
MIELVLFAIAGLLLLWFLVFWNPQEKKAVRSDGRPEVSQAQEALAVLELELLPAAFVERVFSTQDRDFVARQAPPQVRKMFRKERKAIAAAWLGRTRREAGRLMSFHLRLARSEFDLSPATEIRLGVDYVCLLLICHALAAVVRVSGPYTAQVMVGQTVTLASRLCSFSTNMLAALHLAEDNFRDRWTRTSLTD